MHQFRENVSEQTGSMTPKFVLYDDSKLDFEPKRFLLMSTIEFILSTERFSCSLIEKM